jgi:phage/plasmid primase-like uncharacterized protein
MKLHTQEQVHHARDVRIESEVARRGGLELKRRGKELIGPCPRCGGDDRFGVNITKQVFNCRGCGAKGDVIDLVMHLDGSDFKPAVETLTGKRDEPRHDSAAEITRQFRRRDNGEDQRHNLDLANEIWQATQPLSPEAITYFNRRGIDIDMVPEHGGLRFHQRHQCIVGRFTTATGNQPRGIWRRPLPSGDKPKALGPMAGCVIRLWPDEEVERRLVIGEGVETVLAAATLIRHRGTLLQPTWAACSANNMKTFRCSPVSKR